MKKNFFQQNIPLTPTKGHLIAGSIVGFFVFFILLVFQPFGTYNFSMTHKTLFLVGYGFIAAGTYIAFYLAGILLLPKCFDAKNWNLLKELITFLLVFNLMTLACLIYHQQFIGGYYITLPVFIGFLKYSLAVGSVPFFVLYYQKWISIRLTIVETNAESNRSVVKFNSTNKNEMSVNLPEDEILFLKSDGNYIEIVSLANSILKKQLIRNTLNNVLAQLPSDHFCKIHRSYVVNLKHVKRISLDGSNYELHLISNQLKLPVSRSMVKPLKKLLA
ncbi:MAG: LytTR family DNA-binding domain-containing protein [Prolixibacteraceae bacterium]